MTKILLEVRGYKLGELVKFSVKEKLQKKTVICKES